MPPRTRLAKASLLLVLIVDFFVRGNVAHLLGKRPLAGRCFSVTPRTRLAKASLLVVLIVDFFVRGNGAHLLGKRPLAGRCFSVTPSEQTGGQKFKLRLCRRVPPARLVPRRASPCWVFAINFVGQASHSVVSAVLMSYT
jgi:hypothetical protein